MALTLGDLLVYIRGDDKHISKTIDNVQSKVNSFGSGIASSLKQSFSFAIGGVIERGLTSIAGGIQNAAGSAVDSVAKYEGLTLSLESLIARQLRAGDASISMADALAAAAPMAQQLLGWVEKLAIASPFESDDINKAVQLAGAYRFGVEQTKSMTQALVDSAAAGNLSGAAIESAVRSLGQMQAKGKVSAEELNQLNEAGFGTISTLEKMGVTLDDVAAGSVSANQFITAFIEQLATESEGAAGRTMNSWTGLFSTLTGMASTGLREFTTGLIEPFRPLLEALGNAAAADGLRESLRSLGEMIGSFLSPAIEWLTGQLETLPAFFEQASQFIQQFRDELAGLSAGDIMAQLPGALDQISQNLNQTLETLGKAHEGTLANLQGQIDKAGEAMGQKMADIAQKYGPKIAEINERFAKAMADLQERVADSNERFAEETAEAAEAHAKRRADIEKQISKAQESQEEKLTELKKDHARRRRELSMNLLTAESEEQYLNIQSQIKAEDEKYSEQKAKIKEATNDQVAELQARLEEEDKAYGKETAKRQKRHAEELADLRKAMAEQAVERDKQLNKVAADRAKEEAEVKAAYDRQVADLQARIAQENQLYAQAVEEQKALAAQAMADTQADLEQRAANLGKGPAAELAGWVTWLRDGFNELSTIVSNFITNHATPLKGVLLGIGAVILGGGILAALSALVGLLSGISLPILAIIGAVALLYTAWTGNWYGIQETTAAVVAWLQANVPPAWEAIRTKAGEVLLWLQTNIAAALLLIQTWWQQHGAAVMTIITGFWTVVTTLIQTALQTIQYFWQQHGDLITQLITLNWETLKAILIGGTTFFVETLAAFFALITGDWQGFIDHNNAAWQAAWETIKTVTSNSLESIKALFSEAIETWSSLFGDFDWSSIGTNIVGGIQAGLEAAWGELAGWLAEKAAGLAETAMGALAIESPSGLFANKVGKFIPPGIQQGFEAGLPDLRQSLAQGMQSLVPPPPPAGALAGAVGSTTNLISLAQTNNLPTAPTGFDRAGLMNDIQQKTIDLLGQFYTKEG